MKNLLIAMMTLVSLSTFAQSTVTAEHNNEYSKLCYLKQVKLKGYAYVNLVGDCSMDVAINGMNLSLTAVMPDLMENGRRIEFGRIRDVSVVQQKAGQLQISIVSDEMNGNGDVSQKKEVIYVKSINADAGIFSVNRK